MKRNLLRSSLRCLLLGFAFASLTACVVDGRGRIYSPFVFGPVHGHSHHHCR